MNEEWTIKEVILGLLSALMLVVAFLGRGMFGRYDKGLERIAELERNAVTHAQMERRMEKMELLIQQRHDENLDRFDRLEQKLLPHLDKASEWRHRQRTEVNTIRYQLALLLHKIYPDYPRPRFENEDNEQ